MRRRRFLQGLSTVLGMLLAAALTVPGVAFLIEPLRRQRGLHKARPLVKLEDLPLNEPRRIHIRDRRIDAWVHYPEASVGSVWVTRRGQRDVVAFSAVCPHLGCAVDYREAQQQYHCPCHEAAFAADGSILSGPPRRGLDQLRAMIEQIEGHEWVSVVYERFQPGTSEKTSLG